MKIYVIVKTTRYDDGYETLDYETEIIGAYTSFDTAYGYATTILDDAPGVKEKYYDADCVSAQCEGGDGLFRYVKVKVDEVNIESN